MISDIEGFGTELHVDLFVYRKALIEPRIPCKLRRRMLPLEAFL
jgi:hypothetical protein